MSDRVRVRALRGAITCDENTKQEIEEKTQRLVKELLARNELEHDDIVSVVFTATDDLTAEFPAAAARGVGLGDIPLLCARELAIDGAKPMCIRLLVHSRVPERSVTTCRSSRVRRRGRDTSRTRGAPR